MNKKILTAFILFSFSAHAYIPTIESLLRNGGNQDIGNNTAVGILNIERMINAQETELENTPRKNALKLLIGNEDADRPSFIQLDYRDGIVSDSTMNKIHYRGNLSLEKLGLKEGTNIEAAIFYSLLSSLLSNNSKMFMEFFSIVDPSIKKNIDLVNKDQQSLLQQYKYYLSKVASVDEQAKEELQNPLKPDSEEGKLNVKEALRSTFLINDGLVKRVREKNKFYWDLVSPFVYARFDGENHKLKKVVLTTEQGKIEIDCYNYILFNGKLEFPEIIYFKDLSGQMYEIKMSKMYSIKDAPGAFNKRLRNYEKTLNKNPEKNSEIIKPSFML
tara:strand:+ start:486 stop:1478 length:993 start_codon:yes stop_codon:yes gene_type:complete